MKPAVTVTILFVLAIIATIGWAFEIPYVNGTIKGADLITKSGLIGAAIGFILAFVMVRRGSGFIEKFQGFGGSILVFSVLFGLLGHYTNRVLGADSQNVTELPVKQISATWSGRGLTEEEIDLGPQGFYVFLETDDGLIRLLSKSEETPYVGPDRKMKVVYQSGYWGYPRYSLPEDETLKSKTESSTEIPAE